MTSSPNEAVRRLRDGESSIIRTFSGHPVDTAATKWILSSQVTVDWSWLSTSDEAVAMSIRAFGRHLVTNNSPDYVSSQVVFLKKLARPEVLKAVCVDLAEREVMSARTWDAFRGAVAETVSETNRIHYLGAYIRWYIWCTDCGHDAFDPDFAIALERIKFGRSAKGVAVMRQDVTQGPLRRSEYDTLRTSLGSPAAKAVPLADLVATWLFLAFGTNPRSLVLLDETDLRTTTLGDGSTVHELSIPRIKKRTSGARDQFRVRKLIPEIAELVTRLIAQNRAITPINADSADVRPLLRSQEKKHLVGTSVEDQRFRKTSAQLDDAVARVARILDLRAHDGSPLHLTPRRLRYTFATRLVADGASPQEVADALDHTDTGYVMVYFNSRSDVVARLDKAMALALAPIAQAFMGVVIDDESGAVRARDKGSRIRHYSPTMKSLDTVGSCGSFGFCGLFAPIACYTCRHFQAWVDGPHAEVLDELERTRERRLAAGADPKMTQIHDRTMQAVAEVIIRCEARKEETSA